MADDFRIEWRGIPEMQQRLQAYARAVHEAIRAVMEYFAPIVEGYAKDNAAWTDRTANARQSLRAYLNGEAPEPPSGDGAVPYPDLQDLAEEVVALYLSHGMDYGVSLELEHQGRYAIILPTLEAHYEPIMRMIRGIVG